jgi:hypothetical protein
MSFQGNLTTIKAKTGKGPEDFRRLTAEKGFTDGENIWYAPFQSMSRVA